LGTREKRYYFFEAEPIIFRPKYVVYLFLLLFLCLMDGTFTIYLIENGAWEVNPFMRRALDVSNEFFIFIKYFITSAGLFFLLINGHKKVFGLCLVEEIAGLFIIFYEGLIIYEITLYLLL